MNHKHHFLKGGNHCTLCKKKFNRDTQNEGYDETAVQTHSFINTVADVAAFTTTIPSFTPDIPSTDTFNTGGDTGGGGASGSW